MSDPVMKAPVEGIVPAPQPQESTTAAKPLEQDERIAQFARKEKSLRQLAKQLEQDKKAFEAERANVKPDTSWKERLKTDFMGMLAEAGLSHEDVTQSLVNNTPESLQIRQLKAELASLRGDMDTTKQSVNLAQEKAYNQALGQIKRDVQSLIGTDSAYETIKLEDPEGEAVVALIEATYKEDGYVMSNEDAAKQVEDYLVEKAIALAKLPKIQSRLAPTIEEKPAPKADQKTQVQKTEPTTTKTLTNSHTISSQSNASERSRVQRAIMAFRGKSQQ